VVAAAVVFPPDQDPPPGLRDSKTLSGRKRAELLPLIRAHALVVAVAGASVREIDRLNIRVATALAMRRAVVKALKALETLEVDVLLDGLSMKELGHPHDALVDGDALCISIAAAGIVAKETRDRLMRALALRHPRYGWEGNSGYGTPQHLEALRTSGPTRHHRTSFGPVSQLSL
jgi:ribonuclease HII